MKRKILAVILAAVMGLLLCGCDIFTGDTAELISPPALSGDIAPIAEAVKQSAGTDYTFKYPSRGNYRSAVVQNDINSDGIFEAFAFYSVTEENDTAMYIDVIVNKEGTWSSAARQKMIAGGVDRIDFCDLDGDGVLEILVGWEIYGTSEMQLAVYSFKENALLQRMLQQYTHFLCCDLDEDGRNEVFLIRFSAAEQINTASLHTVHEGGVSELYSCRIDATVRTVSEPILSHLSSGRPAVYIDEIKGVGAVTEVVFIEKNNLVSPLLNPETGEVTATLRSSLLQSQDINGDGILEIPVQENVPSVTKSDVNEKLYLTNWCSYNGETLTMQQKTMTNSEDGYHYIISSRHAGQIAVLKDTENRVREIYKYDAASMTVGSCLLTLKAVKKSEWDAGKYSGEVYEELTQDGVSVFLCNISSTAAADGLTLDEVRRNFKLIE